MAAPCSQWIACSPVRKWHHGGPLNRIVRFHTMQRGTFIRPVLATLGVAGVSVFLVIVLFQVSAIPRNFGPSGHPLEMPAIGRAYIDFIAFVYGPISSIVAKAFDRLPWMGWLVSFASITTAVSLQNLLLWFGGKWALETWRARKK